MTESEKALQKVLEDYNKAGLIKESKIQAKKQTLIAEAKAKVVKEQKKLEDMKEVQDIAQKPVKADEPAVELDETEKTFITKFIEYNELTLLNKSNSELTACFEKLLGVNAKAATEELEKRTKEREEVLTKLAKELNDIKEQIIKDTEKAKAKEELVSLFNSVDTLAEQPAEDISKKNIVENKK